MKEILNKIKSKIQDAISQAYLGEIGTFIIGWIILFDLIGGTMIPMAYGKGCGWFAIPNLIIDLYVIKCFVRRLGK